MKGNNKSKYEQWKDSGELGSILTRIKGWAMDGLSYDQIAHNLGLSKPTIYKYIHKYDDFKKALLIGKETADYLVENALFKAAVEGNVTAMMIWLANRNPQKWRRNPTPQDNDTVKKETPKLIEALERDDE